MPSLDHMASSEAGLMKPARASQPWYAKVSFWTGPFTIGVALLVAVGLGVVWYLLGGFPRDHDKYGSVAAPGQQVVQLPKGDVRVNFENDATGSGDTRSIGVRPNGLAVQVRPAAGGAEVGVKDVPRWIFSSISNDRGHEPFGRIEVPTAGRYRIRVTDDTAGGSDVQAASRSAAGTGPAITLGERPWTPLDSVLLGAILAGFAVFLSLLVLTLPFRLIR